MGAGTQGEEAISALLRLGGGGKQGSQEKEYGKEGYSGAHADFFKGYNKLQGNWSGLRGYRDTEIRQEIGR
ncbi:hypothetical protein GCM10023184_01040 [Flaviaesturariibacter amylovorans]|uniref:Uncharacterized protein n=1 Tax=Flaviaesturariibacter amylovorans TaxID=1084520 RepID=A0ABP8G4R6_9BACT